MCIRDRYVVVSLHRKVVGLAYDARDVEQSRRNMTDIDDVRQRCWIGSVIDLVSCDGRLQQLQIVPRYAHPSASHLLNGDICWRHDRDRKESRHLFVTKGVRMPLGIEVTVVIIKCIEVWPG